MTGSDDSERLLRYARKIANSESDRDKRFRAIDQLKDFMRRNDSSTHFKELLFEKLIEILDIIGKCLAEYSRRFTSEVCELLVDIMFAVYQYKGDDKVYNWIGEEKALKWIGDQFELIDSDNKKHRDNLINIVEFIIVNEDFKLKYLDLIINPMRTIVEEADSLPDLLFCLNPLLIIADLYNTDFLPIFEDTADLIIGWLVDPTTDIDSYNQLTEQMIQLRPYWVNSLNDSASYFENFAKDLLDITSDAKSHFENDDPSLQATLGKLEFLVRTYACLMRSIGMNVFRGQKETFNESFIAKNITIMVKVGNDLLTKKRFCQLENVTNNIVEVACLLISSSEWKSLKIPDGLLEFTRRLVDSVPESNCQLPITLVLVLIQEAAPAMPEEFATTIITELSHLKHVENAETVAELLAVYQSALGCTCSQLIQQSAYYTVLGELQATLNELLRYHGAAKRIEIEAIKQFDHSSNKIQPVTDFASEQRALHASLFLVSALTEFANTKVSVLSVHEIEPSFFVLVERELRPAMVELNYPALEFALVTALRSHCECHGHFINNFLGNSRLMNKDSLKQLKFYYQRLMHFVSFLLTKKNGAFSVRDLAISWAKDIIRCVNKTDRSDVMQKSLTSVFEFEELTEATVEAAWQADRGQLLAIHRCLEYAIGAAPDAVAEHVIRGVVWLSSHVDCEIAESYTKLLLNIPASAMYKFNENFQKKADMSVLRRVWFARKSLMSKPQHFTQVQFSCVMDLLLNGEDKGLQDMLERGVWWSGRETKGNLAATYKHLMFWALWDTAAFCIDNRLKTPLGSNKDTLGLIDKTIRNFDRQLSVKPSKLSESTESYQILLSRPRMLISFLQNLEKLLFNAYEGCAVSLPPSSKQVRTFFINNRRTCQLWLRGLRIAVMRVSLHCGMPAEAWFHGEEMIKCMFEDNHGDKDPDRQSFERAILMCAEAALLMKDHERINGLMKYLNNSDLDINLHWLKGCELQAKEKYEFAINEYNVYLKQEEDLRNQSGDDLIRSSEIFIKLQITECLTNISDWSGAETFLMNNSEYTQLGNIDYIKALQSYEDQNYEATQSYGMAFLSQLPERTWRWPLIKQRSDIELLLNKTNRQPNLQSIDKLEEIGRVLILEEGNEWPCNLSHDGIAILHGSSIFRDTKTNNVYSNIKMIALRSKLALCENLPQLCRLTPHTSDMLLKQGMRERKNQNFTRASGLFTKAKGLLKRDQSGRLVSHETLFKIIRQEGKLLAAQQNHYEAVKLLGAKISERLRPVERGPSAARRCPDKRYNVSEDDGVSKGMLNMVKWLEADWARLGPQLEALYKGGDRNEFCQSIEDLIKAEQDMKEKTLVKYSLLEEAQQETVLGCIINLASIKSPSNSKSFKKLGSFCYKWGSKVIDRAIKNGKVALTQHEEQQIETYLQQVQWNNDNELEYQVQLVKELIGTTQLIEYHEDSVEDHIPILQQEEQVTVKLYKTLPWLYQYSTITGGLLQVWRMVSNRLFELYSNSAKAYFEVLRIDGEDIHASLRLLRLLAQHSGGLRHVLEDGFRISSVSAWLEIVPQLFSRLHHPEPYVRNAITQLLERIASERPDDVVFAVVVASNKTDSRIEASLRDLNAKERTENAIGLQNGQAVDEQSHSLNMIRSKLSRIVVNDVELVVRELRRITLLWDELWLGSLNQHYSDIQKRLISLNEEAKRLGSNSSISHNQKAKMMIDQQKALMKPVLTAFQHLAQITAAKPETPHEEKFQRRYGKLIQEALNRLATNPAPMQPALCWSPFKQLHSELQLRAGKRTQLLMKEISPLLAKLKDSYLPVPGQPGLTVTQFHPMLSILPTKTRPKKLHLKGGNGRTYTYLFKGLEDLHLDERIMQFLSVCNKLLPADLSARNYSVTPLGARSGLIGWVHGASPLFVLYKKWQIRQQDKLNLNENIKVDRPSELFFNKLNPALKAAGVSEKTPRRELPSSILREVHRELIKETPSDLIHKEIWCNSTSSSDFLNTQDIYARSLSVMSILGYIIGLGDRHLDNILLDHETGEVVHIDYNICFEKGHQLRVPERVPFRLTKNLEKGLGLCGVNGLFRSASETTLQTLRTGSETLLTLLEAFVYDPLVDWTGAVDVGYAGAIYGGAAATEQPNKIEMEREIHRSLLATRLLEARQPMISLRDETCRTLASLIEKLESYQLINIKLIEEKNKLKIIKSVDRLLDSNDRKIQAIPDKYREYKLSKTQLNRLNEHLAQRMQVLSQQRKVLDNFMVSNSNFYREIDLLSVDVKSPVELGQPPGKIAELFLKEIGQKKMAEDAIEHNNLLRRIIDTKQSYMTKAVTILKDYARVQQLYPKSAMSNHRLVFWYESLLKLSGDMNVDQINEIKDAHETIVQSEDNSIDGTRQRLIKAKYGYLTSAIDEPRDGLKSKLNELRKRRNDEQKSFKDAETCLKTLESAYDKIKFFATNNDERLIFLTTISLFFDNYAKSLEMEEFVKAASYKLVSSNSDQGDWFFDELVSLYNNQKELLRILSEVAPSFYMRLDINDINLTNQVYSRLGKLYSEWKSYIVPETITLVQIEEYTVLIDFIITLAYAQPVNPSVIAPHLSQILKTGQTDESGQTAQYLEIASYIEAQFHKICNDDVPGIMLIRMINSMFAEITEALEQLVHSFANLPVSAEWEPSILQAKELIRNKTLDSNILRSLLFLRQLEAISSFFSLVRSNAIAFISQEQNNVSPKLHSEEELAKPIKVFIATFIQEILLGVPSYAMGRVSCVLLELGLNKKILSKINFSAETKTAIDSDYDSSEILICGDIIKDYDHIWKMSDMTRRVTDAITLTENSLNRAVQQKSSFQWLHEDVIAEHVVCENTDRSNLIKNLNISLTELKSEEKKINELVTKMEYDETTILKRLQWSFAANPRTEPIHMTVVRAKEDRKFVLTEFKDVTKKVMSFVDGVILFETMRLPGFETNKFDMDCIKLLDAASKIISDSSQSSAKLDEDELALTDLIAPPETTQDQNIVEKWRQAAKQHTRSTISKLNHSKSHSNNKIKQVKTQIKDFSNSLIAIHNQRKKILYEVQKILRGIGPDNPSSKPIKIWLDSYTNYSDSLKELSSELNAQSDSILHTDPLISDANQLLDETTKITSSLFVLSEIETEVKIAEKEENENEKLKRNKTAIIIRNRIKEKLEGRDPDNSNVTTVKQQVDYVISESLAIQNLALMYEGWTSWV